MSSEVATGAGGRGADATLDALRRSVDRLRGIVTTLGDDDLDAAAFPAAWTIADVLSHIGSSAVINERRLDDGLAGAATPDDFAPPVWDTWNAKSPRAKADDAVVADRALLERLDGVTRSERDRFACAFGPLRLDFAGFVSLRLNEHTLHTWDVEVAREPVATLPNEGAALVVDQLELIARFTAKPTGADEVVAVRTTAPGRDFTIGLAADAVTFTPDRHDRVPDLTMPAEAFIRLVYGRLDPDQTPSAVKGDERLLGELRRAFPGP